MLEWAPLWLALTGRLLEATCARAATCARIHFTVVQEALIRVLTPIQMARVFLTSFPYNPGKPLACEPCVSMPTVVQA